MVHDYFGEPIAERYDAELGEMSGGWNREPFDGLSTRHVSIWRKTEASQSRGAV